MQKNDQKDFKVRNTSIAQYNGHNYIFVQNAEGFAVTEIKIIGKQEAESIISAPFTGNEQIAVKGAAALKAIWLGLGAGE
jgi:cobalt-zinc-cadmium efflux system membrane fusion protein